MADIKWSEFSSGGNNVVGDELVGLRAGVNLRFTAPNLQSVYNSSTSKIITFPLGEGLIFNDHLNDNKYIFQEDFGTFLNPFIVSVTGDEGISVLASSDINSTMFEVLSPDKGAKPVPAMLETTRDAIPVVDIVDYLEIYNTTTKTMDYYDLTSWQKLLTTSNVSGSGTVTVTDLGDGRIDVFGSGGGPVPDGAYASYVVFNNPFSSAFTGVAGGYKTIPVSSGFTSVVESDFSSTIESVGGVNTPVSRYTGSVTQTFSVKQSIAIQANTNLPRYYYPTISIIRADNSVEQTPYRGQIFISNDQVTPTTVTVVGDVTLNTGDGIFSQVYLTASDATGFSPNINSEICTIAGTTTPVFQNIYDNSLVYPLSSFTLSPSSGEFNVIWPAMSGDQIAFSASSTGISSEIGLELTNTATSEKANFLVTTDATSTLSELKSTTRGSVSYPVMTTAQGSAIGGTKPQGLGYTNSDTNTIDIWTGSVYTSLVNTTSNQTIGGTKTFSSNIIGNLTGNADTATQVNTTVNSSNATFYIPFVASSSSGNQALNINSTINFNPLAGVLTTPNLVLTALSANQLVGLNSGKIASSIGAGTSTTVLHGNASGLPTYSAVDLVNDITGTLLFSHGGFGFTTATTGDIFYASGTDTPGKLSAVASGSVLSSAGVGVAPTWSSSFFVTSVVTVTTSTQSMSFNTLYVNNYSGGQCVYSLPAANTVGKVIELVSLSTASTSGWRVNANGSDTIQYGSSVSAGGGNIVSTSGSATDCAKFVCVASGKWIITTAVGTNLVVT